MPILPQIQAVLKTGHIVHILMKASIPVSLHIDGIELCGTMSQPSSLYNQTSQVRTTPRFLYAYLMVLIFLCLFYPFITAKDQTGEDAGG